ncbi:unnamed protein product [Protopolystoma xenopodis]|uniref:Uncharacterized protein n=1 Tax=Protopolystoma xenopodis TaxID=117903 RepID=A0A448WBX2_9PLAT|nr:unnamed protein product [Protopolystoma xenopodis]
MRHEGEVAWRMPASLVSRHAELAWNLIWQFQRLGLPSHLLDGLPSWLIYLRQRQLDAATAAVTGSSVINLSDDQFSQTRTESKPSLTGTLFVGIRYFYIFKFIITSSSSTIFNIIP